MRSVASIFLWIVFALPADSITLINNGLAPPHPENVFSETLPSEFPGDDVVVRNVGCDDPYADPCVSPGAPTTVAVVDGASLFAIFALDTSRVEILGGEIVGITAATLDESSMLVSGGFIASILEANENSSMVVTGGSIGLHLRSYKNAMVSLFGGSIGGMIRANNASVIEIHGHGFAVDGLPVPFGEVAATSGVLTGTLASGEALDNAFDGSGTIRLVSAPEPATALLVLMGGVGLAGAARARRRQRASQISPRRSLASR